ncbi:lipoprotein NlpD [Geothermobacter ehrlichii]|uniref:Lipoprotein NlpD n=1 Tax=Geothermobacter ehrlichii TaxID=213224 RepID=A0A5D3WR62_9BACT|nr:M23 family metallopeptidase [Geothermobacter ehrlichii]TYP00280.1 lipoprotein NlpD [Geothermobacter ehrlichii]
MRFSRGFLLLTVLLLLAGCSPPRGVYHTVGKGQTLYQISKTYHVDEAYLARVNGIDDPTRLAVGQKLFIPGATRTRYVPPTVKTVAGKPARPSVVSRSSGSRKQPEARKSPPARSGGGAVKKKAETGVRRKPPASRAGRVEKGFFAWPQRGKIVRRFGGRGAGASNGIEIAMPPGSAVFSAAAGKVIYSGNGISGYGNLIVVQHEKDYYSIYGYNRQNLVKAGSFVSKGQKIALSGVPPSGGAPRLYFEIRKGKTPVNPIFYLP